jgi:hypothetical protein
VSLQQQSTLILADRALTQRKQTREASMDVEGVLAALIDSVAYAKAIGCTCSLAVGACCSETVAVSIAARAEIGNAKQGQCRRLASPGRASDAD